MVYVAIEAVRLSGSKVTGIRLVTLLLTFEENESSETSAGIGSRNYLWRRAVSLSSPTTCQSPTIPSMRRDFRSPEPLVK